MESLELELFKAATAQRLFGEPGCPVSSMTSFDVMRFPAQDLWDPRVHSALRMKMNKPVLLFCRSDHRLARKAPCPGGVTATFVTLESTRRRATGIFVSSERNLLSPRGPVSQIIVPALSTEYNSFSPRPRKEKCNEDAT